MKDHDKDGDRLRKAFDDWSKEGTKHHEQMLVAWSKLRDESIKMLTIRFIAVHERKNLQALVEKGWFCTQDDTGERLRKAFAAWAKDSPKNQEQMLEAWAKLRDESIKLMAIRFRAVQARKELQARVAEAAPSWV